jgi:outer membrane protein OmpA-like peptidoglycan-associated protein
MKNLLLLFILVPILSNAQTFVLSDTMFKTNAIYRSYQIKFDYDKATIAKESIGALDSIADFMFKNPTLVIEVGNHCDDRVSDKYSTNLTQARAQAIVDYLLSKGIAKERLVAKGYHNTKPLVPGEKIAYLKSKDEIEKAHAQNRRTEFKILSLEFSN